MSTIACCSGVPQRQLHRSAERFEGPSQRVRAARRAPARRSLPARPIESVPTASDPPDYEGAVGQLLDASSSAWWASPGAKVTFTTVSPEERPPPTAVARLRGWAAAASLSADKICRDRASPALHALRRPLDEHRDHRLGVGRRGCIRSPPRRGSSGRSPAPEQRRPSAARRSRRSRFVSESGAVERCTRSARRGFPVSHRAVSRRHIRRRSSPLGRRPWLWPSARTNRAPMSTSHTLPKR